MRPNFLFYVVGAIAGVLLLGVAAALGLRWMTDAHSSAWLWAATGAAVAIVTMIVGVVIMAVIMIFKDGIAIPAALLATVIGAAMSPAPAHADAVARRGENWVRISVAMCTDPDILAAIAAINDEPGIFRQAQVHINGEDRIACWRPLSRGAGLLFANGNRMLVPTEDLKPETQL